MVALRIGFLTEYYLRSYYTVVAATDEEQFMYQNILIRIKCLPNLFYLTNYQKRYLNSVDSDLAIQSPPNFRPFSLYLSYFLKLKKSIKKFFIKIFLIVQENTEKNGKMRCFGHTFF